MELSMSDIYFPIKSMANDVVNLLGPYVHSTSWYESIVLKMDGAFTKGLCHDHDDFHYSPVKMLTTYLTVLPDGSETGCFYALDLGGTNLRVIEIKIIGNKISPNSISTEIPQSIMKGTKDELFDFMAKCIQDGLIRFGVSDQTINFFGFTFSFPIYQSALNSGKLIRWSKAFNVPGVEGQDVVKLLKEACQKREIKINDFILINDTTGTLLCGAFEDSNAKIGIINGTGTNACYLENVDNVQKLKLESADPQIIINTEWGAFGECGELDDHITPIDKIVDQNSVNPGRQIFEKMISGMYIGELVRLVILEAYEANHFPKQSFPSKLFQYGSFPAQLISDSYDNDVFLSHFEYHFGWKLDEKSLETIVAICHCISLRSACLCASGLAAILNRMKWNQSVISADGSMFSKHPMFLKYVDGMLRILCPDQQFSIILVDDGSGKGAALAACVALKKRTNQN